MSPAAFATKPTSSPEAAIATLQLMMVGRMSRVVKPVGPKSSRVCGTALALSGSVLEPKSRVPARRTASNDITTTEPASGSSGSGSGAVRGCSFSTHPSGVVHCIHKSPVPESATMRKA